MKAWSMILAATDELDLVKITQALSILRVTEHSIECAHTAFGP